jgi:hypothetical protein
MRDGPVSEAVDSDVTPSRPLAVAMQTQSGE